MLAVTRRQNESIFIFPSPEVDPNLTVAELFAGGPIEVMVVRVAERKTRLCILAPERLAIQRSEVSDRTPARLCHSG